MALRALAFAVGLCGLSAPLALAQCTFDGECGPPFGHPCFIYRCIDGECAPPEARNCDDNNACTTDSCDNRLGCVHGLVCPDDRAVCTGPESCEVICIPFPLPIPTGCFDIPVCFSTPPDCNDGLGCTNDFCVEPNGCSHTGVLCEDSDPCTVGDACVEPSGQCSSTPLDCNDNDLCTQDQCVTGFGCFYTPVAGCCRANTECPDLPCATQRQCVAGSCSGGVPPSCDDGNPTTVNTCDPALGCVHTPGGACAGDGECAADQDPCTTAKCAAGACAQQAIGDLAGLVCTCDRTLPEVCAGQAVPRRVAKKSKKACKLIGRMADAKAPRLGKLVRKVTKQYDRAQNAALDAGSGDEPDLSAACAQALGALFGDGLARARALEGQL